MARIIPRTLKGKILAALLGLAAVAILGLVLLVVFWTWLSWVLVAAFVLYGAVVVLLAVGLLGYLVWKRQKLTALRLDWIDSEAQSHL
ncbi:MAG: hypothetical protein F4Y02_02250 [Chloroflexi bacterium]|nr:hypothetical protein [Chloroflexota bacterium]